MAGTNTVAAIKGSTAASAASTVLCTLLCTDKLLLENERAEGRLMLPKSSLLLIDQHQICHLTGLRLKGFSGAVLILSFDSFETLSRKYRILLWGQGSHDTCEPPWTLPRLVAKVRELVPLAPENLKMLQRELRAPERKLKDRVMPILKRLQERNNNIYRDLEKIASVVGVIRSHSPVACHAVVEIGGRKAQIQEHFQRLVEEIRTSGKSEDKVVALREVFERWRALVLETGEGPGPLS